MNKTKTHHSSISATNTCRAPSTDHGWLVVSYWGEQGVTTEGTSITTKGGLCYSSYLILGLEWWAGCRKSKKKNRVKSKEFWEHSSMMWLILSCVAQSKARVYTGESGDSYWTCLILPSSPQLLITFRLMMFQCQLITPPDVSLSLHFLFPCWLGSTDMSSFLSWLQLLFESIQPPQHVCHLPVRWPHTPDLPTHCAQANSCWSRSCSEVRLKT